jgi:hypothetical protein
VSRGWLLVILAGYSGATELVQSQIPGRSMQLVDLLQDFAGIAAGGMLFVVWQRLRGRFEQAEAGTPGNLLRPRRRSESPLMPEPAGDSASS